MVFSAKNIELFDFVDKQFLQELQDNFAKTTEFAYVTVNKNGFITEPSNFTDFCLSTKGFTEGFERCSKCDLERRNLGFKNKEPFIFTCYAGLTNFVVPILVNNKAIALMVGGQTLTQEPDENLYKQLAKDFGIDENEYWDKVKKIRSTLSKEMIKQYFLETICSYFKADRCLFIDYDKKENKFYPFRIEKLKSPNLKSLANLDVEEEFPEFATKIKKGKNIIIRDVEKTLQKNKCENYKSIHSLQKSDAKSDYGLLVKYHDEIKGCIILHFIEEKRNLTHDEFEFLKILSDQAGTALHQSKLYKTIKEQAKRELINRQIIETVRSSLDIDEVQKKVIEAIGKAFNADRCYFRRSNKNLDNVSASIIEYRASEDIESLLGIEPSKDLFEFFLDKVKTERRGFYPIGVNRDSAEDTSLKVYMEKYNIQEDFAIPIIDRQDEFIWLVLHYSKPAPNLSEEDKKSLETIAYQLDTAFEQITLYNAVKKTAKQERLLRDVIETIRTTLDIKVTKTKIVNTICSLFNADRGYIVEYDAISDKFLKIQDEYLSSDEIKSYRTLDLNTSIPTFAEAIKQKKTILINDQEIFLDTNDDLNNEKLNMEKHSIKSAFGFPIVYNDELLGAFSIHYTKNHHISNDEIEFLDLIANQIAIAMHQSRLYKKVELQAERERISRNIIEIMRSSLDKNIIKKLFVKNIGKYFTADRVFICEFDYKNKKFLPVDKNSEYLSNKDQKSFIDIDWSKDEYRNYSQKLKEKREVLI